MANPTLARLSDRALDAVMAIAEVPLNFIEVQSGCYLGEDDIVRFDDRYGRLEEKPKL